MGPSTHSNSQVAATSNGTPLAWQTVRARSRGRPDGAGRARQLKDPEEQFQVRRARPASEQENGAPALKVALPRSSQVGD